LVAIGLKSRIAATLAGVIILFGLFVLGIVYELMGRTLRTQLDYRALAIATNLSDAVAGYVVWKNPLEIYAYLTKYALLEGAAYTFVEDGKGEIIAHTVGGTFPPELRESLSPDRLQQVQRRLLTVIPPIERPGKQ
jgi:sensor histidine kinase regulating citrate/malate metabolism